MASYNRVIMMGNLTKDPDHKQLTSGQAICKLSLASNRQFKNKQTGMMVQEVCFIDVDVWGAQADSCSQYLKKGSGVLVEGRLKFDSWQDNEGQKRSKHSIVADRVTFLQTAASAPQDEEFVGSQEEAPAVSAEPKQEAASAPKHPRKKADKSEKTEKASDEQVSTGEVNFKDEKPFEDDLPF
jgi:single-strand DNA-binding protein